MEFGDEAIRELLSTYPIAVMSQKILDELQKCGSTEGAGFGVEPEVTALQQAWVFLREEIHLLLCTSDRKYAKERTELRTSSKLASTALTALLIQHFGLAAGTAGAMTAVGLLVPVRVLLSSWCNAYSHGAREVEKLEKLELLRLSKTG